jgi:hypothetical protein
MEKKIQGVTKGGNRASFNINVIKTLTNTRTKGH